MLTLPSSTNEVPAWGLKRRSPPVVQCDHAPRPTGHVPLPALEALATELIRLSCFECFNGRVQMPRGPAFNPE